MPADYRIETDLNLVVVTFSGAVTLAEQIATLRAYAADPMRDPAHHGLMDFSDCTMHEHFFEEVQRLAHCIRRTFEGRAESARRTIYAPDDVTYGVNRMLQSLLDGSGPHMEVCRTRAEALDALPLDRENGTYRAFRATWLAPENVAA